MTGSYLDTGVPGRDELLFLPLGGAGEIGMNLNLYGHGGKWLMVDLGITFGDDTTPGVEIIAPDPAFIAERRDDLAGLVLTHAHEDHLGAVPYLWPQIECPVYATPFTASVLRRKLAETDFANRVPIHVVPMSGQFDVGPFAIELVTVTHSIPEPNALIIKTPAGTVLHTGDWKLDPDPLVGPTADEARLMRLGEEGVLAMVCDSTNALVPGRSGSEADLHETLSQLVGRFEKRVVVACFASNVARLQTIVRVAEEHGRTVGLVGRSLWRIYDAARENGYLGDLPPVVGEREAASLPRRDVLLICTGSQAEPRAALTRMAADEHPEIALEEGDAVIFSSRIIPGNERAIARLHNRLIMRGVEVVTTRDAPVHVSGHPARDELIEMYQWVRPKIAIPVHGEPRHLIAHAKLARECQVPHPLVAQNGSLVHLAPGRAEIIDEVHTDRLALDGKRFVSLESAAFRERRRMTYHGSAVATVALDRSGRLHSDPVISVHGLYGPEDESEITEEVADAVVASIEDLTPAQRADDDAIREIVRRAVRRCIRALCGKRPHTEIHLVRV